MSYRDQMEFLGNEEDYRVYRNKDGFLEGYKQIGKNKYSTEGAGGSDVKRIVSNQTTMEGFGKYVLGLKSRTAIKDKPLKISQLPNLPFPEER